MHELADFQNAAKRKSAALQENLRLQRANTLQFSALRAQLRSPQAGISSDYLFAPFFGSNGRLLSITTSPSSDAYGYEAALSNGGLYSALFNVSLPLLDGGALDANQHQSSLLNAQLQSTARVLERNLDKTVGDQFIAVYQLQQQIRFALQIIDLVQDRRGVVEALVLKGLMQQNDYLLLDIELSNRRTDVLQLEASLSDAWAQLRSSCMMSDTTNDELRAPQLQIQPEVAAFALEERFRLDSMVVQSQNEVLQSKYRPQLNAFANAGLNAIDPALIPHNVGMSAGVHLSWTLYDGKQADYAREISGLQIQSMQDYRQAAIVQLRNSLRSLRVQMDRNARAMEMLESQLQRQELLLKMIRDKVLIGQVSVTDYLLAVQDYASAQQKRVQTQASQWLLMNQYNFVNW